MLIPTIPPSTLNAHRVLNPNHVLSLSLTKPLPTQAAENLDELTTHLAVGLHLGEIITTHFPDNPPELAPIRLGNDFSATSAVEQFLGHVNDTYFPLMLMGQEDWLAANPAGLAYIPIEPLGVNYETFVEEAPRDLAEPERFLMTLYVLNSEYFMPAEPLDFWVAMYPNRPFPFLALELADLLPHIERLTLKGALIHLPLLLNYVLQQTGNPWLDMSYNTFMDGYMEYPLWESYGEDLHMYWQEAKPLLGDMGKLFGAFDAGVFSLETIWDLLVQADARSKGQFSLPFK